MLAAAIFVIFPFAMAYAAFSDLVSMTIANRVPLILIGGFAGVALLTGMSVADVALHFAVGLLCLALTFGFFAAGWMGGGDAKLIAATAIWFGPSFHLLEYLLFGAMYGGALTIALLMARASMVPATGLDFVDRLLDRETGVPYGIALGAAGLTVYSSHPFVEAAIAGVF